MFLHKFSSPSYCNFSISIGFLLILLCYFAFILSKVNLCMLCVFFVAGKLPSQIEKGADCYSSSVVQGAIQNPPSLCPGETA